MRAGVQGVLEGRKWQEGGGTGRVLTVHRGRAAGGEDDRDDIPLVAHTAEPPPPPPLARPPLPPHTQDRRVK